MAQMTAEDALKAGAQLIADLIEGLAGRRDGREQIAASLAESLPRARNAAEAEVVRRVMARLVGGAIAAPPADAKKVCPECGHVFKGHGWDGIDAHWKSKHNDVMPYHDAWPLLAAGTYPGMS